MLTAIPSYLRLAAVLQASYDLSTSAHCTHTLTDALFNLGHRTPADVLQILLGDIV